MIFYFGVDMTEVRIKGLSQTCFLSVVFLKNEKVRESFAKEEKEGMDWFSSFSSFLPRTHFCELVLYPLELTRK